MTWANAKIKRIMIWDKQVRPTFFLRKIFDFSDNDLHWFTYRTTGGNWLTIDTTNRYCTDNNPWYWCYYKQVNYKKCRQRIKWRLTGWWSLICWVGNDYAPSSWFSCSLWFDNSKFFVWIKGMSSYSTISSPSWFNWAEWHYYDTIWDNGSVTVKVLNLDESVVVSNTYTATESTQKYIWFCWWTYPKRAMYISEYRLAYEE